MKKNVAGQQFYVFAFGGDSHASPGEPVTGDAAQITAKVSKDGGGAAATNDTNPTEIEDGFYAFNATQAETNADTILVLPESSTANVEVIAVPAVIFTDPPNFSDLNIGTDGVAEANVVQHLGVTLAYTGQIQSVTADTPVTGVTRIGIEDHSLSSSAADQYVPWSLIFFDRATGEVLGGGQVGNHDTVTPYVDIDATAVTPTTSMDYLLAFSPAGSPLAGDTPIVELEDGGLTATKIAANAITAAKIATDAITAAKLAADAVTEIQSGLSTLTAAQVNTEVDTALSDYDAPTKAELDAGLAGLNDPTATEIRDAITGGAYALDTDANGRIRLVVGTAAGEVTLSGGIVAADVQEVDGAAISQGGSDPANPYGV